MKKIYALAAVVMILASSFSLTSNGYGAFYCAAHASPANLPCSVISDVTECASGTGTSYKKYNNWGGNPSSCTGTTATVCTTLTMFYVQP